MAPYFAPIFDSERYCCLLSFMVSFMAITGTAYSTFFWTWIFWSFFCRRRW